MEQRLKDFLGVKHLFFVANGTIALQIAIKALDLRGEIITTPFSYVATTSTLVWEGGRPVFVDINPDTLCINPDLIEQAITHETSAILPTHVYGYPCDVERIERIAKDHKLKVIYDAAHAFGVKHKGIALCNYGDISTLSFHATKLFHTGEGGAVVTNDDELAQRIKYMLNFGHKGQEDFYGLGINGKNSEMHAALGLCILPRVPELIVRRKELCGYYDTLLDRSGLTRPVYPADVLYNYAYYPVLFPSNERLLKTLKTLNEHEIYPRRYFYPSLNTLPYLPYESKPAAEAVAERVLCLPLSHYLTQDEINQICNLILKELAA